MVKKSLSRIYLAIIFLFLYLPIGVLIVLSFNNSLSRVKWGGFTTEWYRNLVSDPTIMNAFYTTILITVASSVIATIIGTMAAWYRAKTLRLLILRILHTRRSLQSRWTQVLIMY